MQWTQINRYYLQSGEWTICKYFSPGKQYALWHKGTLKGFFDKSDEAKGAANEIPNMATKHLSSKAIQGS